MKIKWSKWFPMPSPDTCRQIEGPLGPGVYQLQNRKTKEFILFGESKYCKDRMESLFPKPYGKGTRNNEEKRQYVLAKWKELNFRTINAKTKEEAVAVDRYLKSLNIHRFNT